MIEDFEDIDASTSERDLLKTLDKLEQQLYKELTTKQWKAHRLVAEIEMELRLREGS